MWCERPCIDNYWKGKRENIRPRPIKTLLSRGARSELHRHDRASNSLERAIYRCKKVSMINRRVRGRWRPVNPQPKQNKWALRTRQKARARGPINLLRTMPKASVTLCLRWNASLIIAITFGRHLLRTRLLLFIYCHWHIDRHFTFSLISEQIRLFIYHSIGIKGRFDSIWKLLMLTQCILLSSFRNVDKFHRFLTINDKIYTKI
jgi:hypothetical protein